MPGNGVGDRDNHFFGQESLSQGHSRLDVVDRTWPGLSNNLLVGSQRQSGFPFIPDLKNYSVQQSDIDARHGSPFHIPHGLSFAQTNMQPELSGSQFHSLQTSLNGYIQGHQFFPAAQNEANLLGMDTESDQHNLGSKGYPILDSQRVRGRDLHRHDPVKSMNAEAPVSFNFSSRQEQMGGQHPSAMQSFHGQQSSISDMQLLQQQLMLKQLQDVRRQMLQQQENWKKNSASQLSVMAKPALASHPSMQLNGIPVNDVSSYSWQSGLTENTSWVPRGASPVLQGSSGSLILSPEQVQGPHVMGLVPQQVNQSIYEVSHSGSKEDLSQISQMEIDDIAMQQIASNVHSLPGSLCSSLPDHGSVQDGHLVSKQFEDVGHGLCSGFNLGNSQQVNSPHGNVSVEEFDGSQEFAHLSEAPQGKTSSSVASSQSVGTLDPTEERILFGADDSVWGAFGGGTNVVAGNYSMCDGSGSLSGFPSVQSGSWSALMQSALAETSSDNQIVQEEWSGLSVQSAQPSISNQKPLSENESARQQLAWGDDTLQTSLLSSRSVQLANNVVRSGGFPSVSVFQQSDLRALHGQSENVKTASSGRSEILQADSPRTIHDFSDGNRWLERSHLQRNSSEGSQICGTIADSSDAEGKRIMGGSWTVQQSMSSSIPGDQQNNRSGWNVIEPAMPGHHAVSNDYSRNALLSFQNVSHNRSLHEQVSHGVAVSNADSVPTDGLEHAEPIDRQNSSTSNAAMMTLNTRRSQGESIQPLAKSHGFNFWRTVDSSMNTQRTEVQGSNCNSLDKSVQTMQSLAINRMYERENLNGKDNLASGFHLNASLHRSTDIFQEHEWSNADEFGNLRERKQNAFGECAQKPTGIHKFQYHPMGNLNVDMESPRGVNQVSLSRAMPQQVSGAIRSPGQGLSASSNITAQTDKSNAGMEKVDLKGTEATLPGMLVASNDLSSLRRSLVSSSSNENAQSSQKMLEHLHKVDQLREHGASSHLSSSDLNETNEAENSDGSISHVQRNQYPQTKSSWFEQYRTLKNGQVLQVYDARQMANVKAMQQAVIAQKPADGLQHPNFVAQAHSAFPAGPLSNACSTTTPASEHMSLHHSLRPDAMPPKLLVKPKKRKSTMSGPLAWHKEVAEGARRLHELSMAEEEWATATNMLVEKVDHESDPHETVLPAHRPKRRLLSTTQLMQLLFQPPPAAFLTADSSSHFEDIAYFAGRLTLGNACSIISCPNSEKTLSRLPEVSDRTDDTSLSKSVDELVGRIKNLETELSRLGKRFSIIDLRVECQDLERFSVINRFAKFHCRGQATNGTGTSSSDSGAGNQKVFIQRYVAALPVPKNLPDRVQCLPL